MKKIIFLIIIVSIALGISFHLREDKSLSFKEHVIELKSNIYGNVKKFLISQLHLPADLGTRIKEKKDLLVKRIKQTDAAKQSAGIIKGAAPPKNLVTVYLRNEAALSGELISETDGSVTILWEGGKVKFYRAEIVRVEYGKRVEEAEGMLFPTEEAWKYANNPVIQLKNLSVLDAKIVGVKPDIVVLEYAFEEGGVIIQDISRDDIENLIFKGINNEESIKIESSLRELFPKMRAHKEGPVTILTDSYITWAREYKKILRRQLTDFYLNYFELIKNRNLSLQSFVVVFDNYVDFFEYALTDGVPAWAVLGYFNPAHKAVFLFNTLGEKYSELLYEAILGKSSRGIDKVAGAVKGMVDKRHHIFIEGQADDIKDKFNKAYNVIKGGLRNLTSTALRHEFTHQLFANWKIQNIIMSKISGLDKKLIDKKKAFMESGNFQDKRKYLIKLMMLRRKEVESINMAAANSWFVEGMATYSEWEDFGGENRTWLYLFQDAKRNNSIFPIEHLMVYRMGSFPGVAFQSTLYMYAQSWAFTHFLMNRYHEQFMGFLDRVAKKEPKGNEDLQWFEGAMGKDLRTIESEFMEYMEQFPELDDPDIERYMALTKIFRQF